MLYKLFEYLGSRFDIPGQGLMGYLSFRAMLCAVVSLLLALIVGKKVIKTLQKKQIGEEIRDLGLADQEKKKGTPTMGGIIIISATLISVLLFANISSIYIILLVFTTVWLGAMGFIDDYIKVFKHDKAGMSEKTKIVGQVSLGLIIALAVCFSPDIVVREKVAVETEIRSNEREGLNVDTEKRVTTKSWVNEDVVKSTKTTIPFVKNHEFDYKVLSPFKGKWGWYCKWLIYMLMIIFVVTACSNSVNLTDGLDGLASGVSLSSVITLGIFAWLSGNVINAGYLNIMYIPDAGEIFVFLAALAGALIGFLWYNSYPAQVFMGDTGSLAIGGIIGVSAVLIRKELLLPMLCGVFFVEALSVIIQRGYFKLTKKKYGTGRRVFKMSPLHHHFQKDGIEALIMKPSGVQHEVKIVNRFWIVGIILAVATLALLKIR